MIDLSPVFIRKKIKWQIENPPTRQSNFIIKLFFLRRVHTYEKNYIIKMTTENGKEKYKIIKYFSKISNKWFFFREENGKNKRNMLSDYDVGDEDNNNVMIPAGSYTFVFFSNTKNGWQCKVIRKENSRNKKIFDPLSWKEATPFFIHTSSKIIKLPRRFSRLLLEK